MSNISLESFYHHELVKTLHDFFLMHGLEKTYWIAYSGGLDSHVLLSLCHILHLKYALKFKVIHVNHNLSIHALEWAKHCANVCHTYQFEYFERTIQLEKSAGKSLEEQAREKRYSLFAEYLNQGEILLTAHQEDDQAETLLLQLFRGAGPKGLSAMPSIKPFAKGFHARPLLAFPRSLLQSYALSAKLQWIEDESNLNIQLTRNFIRQQLLPLLKNRFPSITKTIARSARYCAETASLLDYFMDERLIHTRGTNEKNLSVTKLLQWPSHEQKMILRMWIASLDYPLPNAKKLTSIQENVLTAKQDRFPCIKWQHVALRRFRDDLFLEQILPNHDDKQVLTWNLNHPLVLPHIGILRANRVIGRGFTAKKKEVIIQFRRGGEVIHIANRGHRTLKKLFQEWLIPPWQRSRIPLIFMEDKLAAVVGYFLDEDHRAKINETGWEILLEPLPQHNGRGND